jgi:hypothetical protein
MHSCKLLFGNDDLTVRFIEKMFHSLKQTFVEAHLRNALKMLGFEFTITETLDTLHRPMEKLPERQGFREMYVLTTSESALEIIIPYGCSNRISRSFALKITSHFAYTHNYHDDSCETGILGFSVIEKMIFADEDPCCSLGHEIFMRKVMCQSEGQSQKINKSKLNL